MSSFSEGKRKKKKKTKTENLFHTCQATRWLPEGDKGCAVLPHSLAGQERLWEGYISVQLWQVSNKKQISGAWDAATQHTAWAISVLGAGNHQGTLNKHNSILLSSFKTQISGAEKRAGTKGIFLPAQLRKRNKGHKGWGRCYSNWDQANLKQLNFALMSAQVTKGKKQ